MSHWNFRWYLKSNLTLLLEQCVRDILKMFIESHPCVSADVEVAVVLADAAPHRLGLLPQPVRNVHLLRLVPAERGVECEEAVADERL